MSKQPVRVVDCASSPRRHLQRRPGNRCAYVELSGEANNVRAGMSATLSDERTQGCPALFMFYSRSWAYQSGLDEPEIRFNPISTTDWAFPPPCPSRSRRAAES